MTRIPTDWPNRFSGIPHLDWGRSRAGADCWGLAQIVYAEMLGIALPDYAGSVSAAEHAEIAARIKGAAQTPTWRDVTLGAEQPFDLAVFKRGLHPRHIGIVVRPGLMIHAMAHLGATLAPFDYGYWNTRFTGLYRHVQTGDLT